MSRRISVYFALSTLNLLFWGIPLKAEESSTPVAKGQGTTPQNEDHPQSSAHPTRIYADSFLVWIYARPERDPAPIGYLRGGQSALLRSHEGAPVAQRVRGGCGKGWYAVEPAGFICLDHAASLFPTRYGNSMTEIGPDTGAHPFDYALSMGTPSYRRIPEPHEWERREREFGEAKPRPLPPHWQGHEELVSDDTLASIPIPSFLKNKGSVAREPEKRLERRDVPFGSMLAVRGSFEAFGRQFLQSADGTVVPASRMRLFKRSTFEGVTIDPKPENGWQLPLAWPRKETRHYRLASRVECAPNQPETEANTPVRTRSEQGRLTEKPKQLPQECLVPTDQVRAPRIAHQLSGRVVEVAGTRFAEVTSRGSNAESSWLPTRYLYIAEKKSATGPRNDSGEPIEADGSSRKWIHFSIGQGTLVSYVGDQPVFATLGSPGIGGVPAVGADPLDTRTTPVGSYRIHFKHLSDDMSPEQTEERKFWIADVPHAMYFKQPFAIHVAYWHESFGEPMSGGCINVSPRDGARLFEFTGPQLPEGWYGVGSSKAFGYGTTVVIER